MNTDTVPRGHHSGPPLLLPAVVYTVLVVAGAVIGGSTFTAPHDAAHQGAAYVASIDSKLRWGSFLRIRFLHSAPDLRRHRGQPPALPPRPRRW